MSERIPVKEAAKRIRKAIKSHTDGKKISVKMCTGTAHGYIDISGSEDFGNFSDSERKLLKSFGMHPGGNFSCISPEGRTFWVNELEAL